MITRATLSTIEQGLPKYRSMLAGNPAYSPSSFESIATSTPTSGSTVTFSAIPGTYQHLQFRMIIPGGSSSNMYANFNGDNTGANYAAHILIANGSTVTVSGAAPYGAVRILDSTPSSSTYFAPAIIDIMDYANTTKNKTVRGFFGWDENSSGRSGLESSLWLSTSAITSVTFTYGGTFVSGTSIALYGIKGS